MNKLLDKFHIISLTNPNLVLEYWTPERMAEAVPIDRLFPGLTAKKENLFDEAFSVDANSYPYNCGGKVFFETERGAKFQGTAQFVAHCQMLLTCAHNIKHPETGEMFRNHMFMQSYKLEGLGNELGTKYAIDRVGAPSAYFPHKVSVDYGWMHTTTKSPVYYGLQIGLPHDNFRIIGYPYSKDFGNSMHALDVTKVSVQDNEVRTNKTFDSPAVGVSGGAWVVNLSAEPQYDKNLVVGVTSSGSSTSQYSAYFTNDVIDLFREVRALGPGPHPPGNECAVFTNH
jgi:V8-like Glu-specific endopeptidase